MKTNKIMFIIGSALVVIGVLIIMNAVSFSRPSDANMQECMTQLNQWEKIDSTNKATIKTYEGIVKQYQQTIATYEKLMSNKSEPSYQWDQQDKKTFNEICDSPKGAWSYAVAESRIGPPLKLADDDREKMSHWMGDKNLEVYFSGYLITKDKP